MVYYHIVSNVSNILSQIDPSIENMFVRKTSQYPVRAFLLPLLYVDKYRFGLIVSERELVIGATSMHPDINVDNQEVTDVDHTSINITYWCHLVSHGIEVTS